eukprot:763139-Hanusia_phi.AAC.2
MVRAVLPRGVCGMSWTRATRHHLPSVMRRLVSLPRRPGTSPSAPTRAGSGWNLNAQLPPQSHGRRSFPTAIGSVTGSTEDCGTPGVMVDLIEFPDNSILYDKYLELAVAAISLSILLSVYLYVSSFKRGSSRCSISGSKSHVWHQVPCWPREATQGRPPPRSSLLLSRSQMCPVRLLDGKGAEPTAGRL